MNRKRLKALLIGPAFRTGEIGGLQIALQDLQEQLNRYGWHVDAATYDAPGALSVTTQRSLFAHFQHLSLVMAVRDRLPPALRRLVAALFMPRTFLLHASHNLQILEQRLKAAPDVDVVLLCLELSPPGIAALACELHPCVVVVSLGGLGLELRLRRIWSLLAQVARLRIGSSVHPAFYRPIEPDRLGTTIFASRQWRDEAVQAGLPPDKAHVIPFGIPLPPAPERTGDTSGRLLWIGRLAPEKGLHLLIEALPAIRAHYGHATLTAIAGPGPAAYRRHIQRRIHDLGLHESVRLISGVPREQLQSAYAQHDLLWFHSEYDDPVALVLMEAFAAGLPVVASHARPDALLVHHEQTCLCYRPADQTTIVTAVLRLLKDPGLRMQLMRRAQARVSARFSLEAMGAAYDRVLRRCL
jgi:glycosyltransferase involved in cell wall biosynthesis